MKVDYEDMKGLAAMAIQNGKEKDWIFLAIEWMEEANAEIVRLRADREMEDGR